MIKTSTNSAKTVKNRQNVKPINDRESAVAGSIKFVTIERTMTIVVIDDTI